MHIISDIKLSVYYNSYTVTVAKWAPTETLPPANLLGDCMAQLHFVGHS